MAITYHYILRAMALRIDALTGADAAALQASYLTTPLTTAQWQSAIFPFDAAIDSLAMAEAMMAAAVADTKDQEWRKIMKTVTATVASGTAIPAVDASNRKLIGKLGDVYDANGGHKLTKKSHSYVAKLIRQASIGRSRLTHRHYALEDDRIWHTVTQAYIDGCIYDADVQHTNIGLNTGLFFPEITWPALMCGGLSLLFRGGEFESQAAGYGSYWEAQLGLINKGIATAPNRPVPEPKGADGV